MSRAALERSEASYQSRLAEFKAQEARVRAAAITEGFHVLVAPYAGVISMVTIERGDMALPGRSLMTLFDPMQMRVSADVPESIAADMRKNAARIEIPSARVVVHLDGGGDLTVLPQRNAGSHSVTLRLALPFTATNLAPGSYARVGFSLPRLTAAWASRVKLPTQALFRRSELTAVYVIDAGGKPLLRLVRTGRVEGAETEILAGLSPGERVVLQPLSVVPHD